MQITHGDKMALHIAELYDLRRITFFALNACMYARTYKRTHVHTYMHGYRLLGRHLQGGRRAAQGEVTAKWSLAYIEKASTWLLP